jgi:hypothetical protein
MPTKARGAYSTTGIDFYDNVSAETTVPMAPVVFYDDFVTTTGLGVATNGAIWATKDTGGASEAAVADAINGQVALTLAVTDEKEEAGIYFGDQRCFLPGQGLVFETRVCVSVTPTLLADICWGMCSDYVEDIDATTSHAVFKVDGSTAVVCESDNNVTDTDDTATAVVAGTTTWRVYRIDLSDAADVKFYIDGNRVAAATTFKVLVGTNLQPYFYAFKSTGAGLGTLLIDYCRVWQARS